MRPDALEHNVRLLLRRAYVPALPTPLFRDRLEALVLAELARRASLRPRARPALWPRLVVAAAAALVLAFLGWRRLAPEGAPTRAGLLARGEVALGLPDGRWRAAREEERLRGVAFVPPALVALTPAGVELDVLVGRGRLRLAERSELELREEAHGPAATLHAGSAWLLRGEERTPLVIGRSQALASAPALAGPAAEAPPPVAREATPPLAAPPTPAAPAASARALTGSVVAAADGQPVPAFTLGLLPERRGNATPPPLTRAFRAADGRFRWEDPPSGRQRVFVHAPGFALYALGELDLAGELAELTVELVPGESVRGFVIDENGAPVADALVLSEQETPTDGLLLTQSELAFWLPIQARSAADGSFELAHLAPGLHTLRASARGRAPSWRTGVRVPADPSEELLLTLGPGGTIAGTVLREDGGPWAGAELVVVTMDQEERARTNFGLAKTDARGRYRFEHVPATTMIVVLLRSDEQPDVRPVQVAAGAIVTVDFESAQRGARLHGRVLDGEGRPIPRRNLGLFDAETASWNQDWVASSTRADGTYVFERVEPGRYELLLIDDLGRGLHRVGRVELQAGVLELEHDVRVPESSLEVALHTAEGAPVELSAVILTELEADGRESFAGYAPSDAEGRCRFPGVLPGQYRIVAYPTRADLGFALSELVRLGEGERATVELVHEPGGMVRIVARTGNGQPLEGAAVVFHDEAGLQHLFSRVPLTDVAGRYQAYGLRPGAYRVEAVLEGWRSEPVRFRLELGRELEIPVVLTPR